MLIARVLLLALAVLFAAFAASAQSARDICGPAGVVPLSSEPAAKIVIDPPLPDSLAHGRIVIQYRTENLRIVPVFGPGRSPCRRDIGHIHVTVNDAPWKWAGAGSKPLITSGLPFGPHKVLIELVNAC